MRQWSDASRETPIEPSEHAKYLGIWLDKLLNFTMHRKKLLAKSCREPRSLSGHLRVYVGRIINGHA
jgi:hypothetical protein